MKFLTDEFYAEFTARLKDIFSPAKTTTKLSLTLRETFLAVPQLGGKDAWYLLELRDGVLTGFTNGLGLDGAPQADYIATSDYDTTRKLMSGEIGLAKALTSGKIKLKGNLMKALKMLDSYNVVQETKKLDGATEW